MEYKNFAVINDHGEMYAICPHCEIWIPYKMYKVDKECKNCGYHKEKEK